MDHSSARSDSKSLHLVHYRLLVLLQVILLLILFPSTMADTVYGANAHDPYQSLFEMPNKHDHKASGKKPDTVLDRHCYCASEQLKQDLAPVIRRRLRDLLNKALTVESLTEAAHTIDLLKILHGSNSKLGTIPNGMYQAAQTLKSALAEIPDEV